MDPEMMDQQTPESDPANDIATPPATPDGDSDGGKEDGGDTGPLDEISVKPAEEGGYIVSHHPKAPERVKTMNPDKYKPRVHAKKNHEDLVKHLHKHTKRLKP